MINMCFHFGYAAVMHASRDTGHAMDNDLHRVVAIGIAPALRRRRDVAADLTAAD
jgi:hypothetical protein